MNNISAKEVPISSREDIIYREEKGQNAFNKFVGSRLEKRKCQRLHKGSNSKDETEDVQYMPQKGQM